MPLLAYGTKRQVEFKSVEEYYESLGFLSKNDRGSKLTWENNDEQGAWGKEGRIHFYKEKVNCPNYFSNPGTKPSGGKMRFRVNCNAFVRHLVLDRGFQYGFIQDRTKILATIPPKYRVDFNRGLNY